jgi:peptidoglycan hydrolase-like protein with peptidoglycan-binding domain
MSKTAVITFVVAVVAAGSAVAWWLASPRDDTHVPASVTVDTVAVVRTTLTTTTQLSGTLGYAGAYAVVDELPGMVTALPTPGDLIRRGRRVFEVDGARVFLFYGARPAWRAFSLGMTPGPDVRQLERNLAALGFGAHLAVDDTFTWYTELAVARWQRATQQPVTGQIDLGRVLFAPTSLRVVAAEISLGAPAQPGQPVITASSPNPVVTVPVPANQTYLVHRGDRVTVTVPSGATSSGRVVAVSPVAAAAADESGQSNGPNGPPQASVPALVALDHPSVAARLDQAPVTVTVVDRSVKGALAVPVTSLVALAGGGYAVWVDAAGGRHLVAVTPGLFADTLVQVTAPALRVGDRVEVPAR